MTPASPTLRDAEPRDAGAIVALVRAGFSPELVEAFIYGCDGVERYVRALIEDRGAGVDTSYSVAESGGRVVGCIEMRSLAEELCLNYVAVDAELRTAKLGSRLLEYAIRRDRRPEHRRLSLDVLQHNTVARQWYDRLGMRRDSSTVWYTCPVPESAAGEPLATRVIGLPQARIVQRELGFSQFRIACPERSYDIGMLGQKWFRTSLVEALDDRSLAAALRRLDPARQLLALVRSDAALPPGSPARRLTATDRLSGPLDEIARELEGSLPRP